MSSTDTGLASSTRMSSTDTGLACSLRILVGGMDVLPAVAGAFDLGVATRGQLVMACADVCSSRPARAHLAPFADGGFELGKRVRGSAALSMSIDPQHL